jgi:hypothetical protein
MGHGLAGPDGEAAERCVKTHPDDNATIFIFQVFQLTKSIFDAPFNRIHDADGV